MNETVIKFTPVSGTDTMMKKSWTERISTRHHCITCMKEYNARGESKSLEELRLQDYNSERKGKCTSLISMFYVTLFRWNTFVKIMYFDRKLINYCYFQINSIFFRSNRQL